MGKTPNIDGHFGCNSNGEHEWCERCLLTDCRIRNTIWFGKKVTTAEDICSEAFDKGVDAMSEEMKKHKCEYIKEDTEFDTFIDKLAENLKKGESK